MTLRALPIKDKFLTPQGEISEPWRKWLNEAALTGAGEGHITILPWHYSGVTQGTWALAVDTLLVMNGYLSNSSNSQNDRVDYKAFLAAGTYTFSILPITNLNRAILTLLFDGVSQGTIDLYTASTGYNATKSITNIIVETAGLKTISLKAATRHASSTGWYLTISSISLFRTA